MRAIFKRELYSYLVTPQGYVFIGAFVLVMNLFFYFSNVHGRVSALGAVFAFMLTVLMLTVPILTMRLFSEEYRHGTDRLLLTVPIPLRDIVLGKFFAALSLFGIALLSSLIWVEIVALFGGFNLAEYIGNMVAILTFASVYIAMGLFISALTHSQTIAMITSLGLFTALFLLDVAVSVMPDSGLNRFLSAFSLFKRYDSFSRGVFSMVDIIFCVSACALFLFLTTFVLHYRRQGFKGQHLRLLSVALPALAVLVAINLLTSALEDRFYLKIDMTRSNVFALSQETVYTLQELPEEVTLTMLVTPNDLTGVVYDDLTGAGYQLSDLREALEKYKATANQNFTLQYIDPDLNPAWIQARDLTNEAGYYSVIVESKRRTRVVSLRELFETQTLYDTEGNAVQEMVVGLSAERTLTSAILNVVAEVLPTAVIIEGHNEYPLEVFETMLASANFQVQHLNLSAAAIPENASLLILASPQYDFSAQELAAMDAFLSGGGHGIIALDPANPALPNLGQYLTEWGVRFENVYVCDQTLNSGNPDLLLPVVLENQFTKLSGLNSRYALLAGAGPITLLWETDGTRVTTPLMTSYDTAYGKRLQEDKVLTDLSPAGGDAAGPFTLGTVTEQVFANGTGSYTFFLPLSLLVDYAIGLPNYLNRPLVLRWLSLLQPDMALDIAPQDTTDIPLVLNSQETTVLFILLVIAIPLVVFGIGFATWLRRRKL